MAQTSIAKKAPARSNDRAGQSRGAHGDLDLRVAWSGTALTTDEVQAALGDIWDRPAAKPVPPQRDFAHTGPDTLAGRLLRKAWQPVYVAGDLKPGWARTVKVLSEEITLYRGQDGKAFAVGGRCAHRGLLLSTGMVDGDCIRCAYHGWTYDTAGRLRATPAFGAAPDFDKKDFALFPVRVDTWRGFVFVNLDPAAGPLAEGLGDPVKETANFPIEEGLRLMAEYEARAG